MTTSSSNNNNNQFHQQPYRNSNNYHHDQATTTITTPASATVISSSSAAAPRWRQQKQIRNKSSASTEEEIDRYAQQLIEHTARTQQQEQQRGIDNDNDDTVVSSLYIDDSLGPYITNCLRTALSEMNIGTMASSMIDITTIADYESFCELIQEHCQIEIIDSDNHNNESNHAPAHVAINVLQKILTAIITQHVPPEDWMMVHNTVTTTDSSDRSQPSHNNTDSHLYDTTTTTAVVVVVDTNGDAEDTHDDDDDDDTTTAAIVTDTTTLLPPPGIQQMVSPKQFKQVETTIIPTKAKSKNMNSNSQLMEHQQQPFDRDQEIVLQHEQQHQYEAGHGDRHHNHHHDADEYIRSNIVNMLLQMFVQQDLAYEAAYAATLLAENNILLAQYILSYGFTQMPICKHLMNTGKCYRADCTFNHSIEHHTCVFWMKSRGCSKPTSDPCRFLHGFSRTIVETVPDSIRQQIQQQQTNHNNSTISQPIQNVRDFYATNPNDTIRTSHNNYTTATNQSSTGSNDGSSNSVWGFSSKTSFANIAAQGFNTQKSFVETIKTSPYNSNTSDSNNKSKDNHTLSSAASIQQQVQQLSTMLIPQNLWHAHENRDASVFYITDPMERYWAVSKSKSSPPLKKNSGGSCTVIDLHYQSIKTFPIVLDTILPNKLLSVAASYPNDDDSSNTTGIWIITGTGHSVNAQKTHQKGGGTLEIAVLEYLFSNYQCHASSSSASRTGSPISIRIYKGRDRNGKGGAIYIQPQK